MHSESQPDSPTGRNQSTGRWLVLVAALLCLGPTGCHSYRALPDATPAELRGPTLAQRDVEAIADEYLSALLEYAPELGTMYSLPGAPHDRLSDHSPEARAAWQARLGDLGHPARDPGQLGRYPRLPQRTVGGQQHDRLAHVGAESVRDTARRYS